MSESDSLVVCCESHAGMIDTAVATGSAPQDAVRVRVRRWAASSSTRLSA